MRASTSTIELTLNDDSDYSEWNYEQTDIEPDYVDYNLVCMAAENIDFKTASPETKLAWTLFALKFPIV